MLPQLLVVQLVQLLQMALLQHIDWQVLGGIPLMTHCWKQPIAAAQLGLFRQLTVCMQQLPTMHWLQGVPPGSSGHMPASTGIPQCPPEQTSGLQHCPVVEQLEP